MFQKSFEESAKHHSKKRKRAMNLNPLWIRYFEILEDMYHFKLQEISNKRGFRAQPNTLECDGGLDEF